MVSEKCHIFHVRNVESVGSAGAVYLADNDVLLFFVPGNFRPTLSLLNYLLDILV